jgi:hypothetical protein
VSMRGRAHGTPLRISPTIAMRPPVRPERVGQGERSVSGDRVDSLDQGPPIAGRPGLAIGTSCAGDSSWTGSPPVCPFSLLLPFTLDSVESLPSFFAVGLALF